MELEEEREEAGKAENREEKTSIKTAAGDFPGGAVVEGPPANAGDMGSSPGPGRSHVPRGSWAHVPQLLSLSSGARKPQLRSPHATATAAHAPRARALQQERPLQ